MFFRLYTPARFSTVAHHNPCNSHFHPQQVCHLVTKIHYTGAVAVCEFRLFAISVITSWIIILKR